MQTAPIPEDRSTAHVTQGILETELHALVNLHVLILSLYQYITWLTQFSPSPFPSYLA